MKRAGTPKAQTPMGDDDSGYVVSLPDYTPPVRYDDLPWTTALIGEGQTSSGPFTTIDTITLDPVDADPSNPIARSLTSSAATLPAGWYQLTFQDASGAQSVCTPVPLPGPEPQASVPYCTVLDVQGRNAQRPVSASSVPNIAQVGQFVLDAAAEINAILVHKGYQIPVNSASNPDAFATLHAINVTGGWWMMEAAAPVSPNVDRAEKAWVAAKKMLASAEFTLNAPKDIARSEPRGPWITTQPTGRVFDPLFGRNEGGRRGNPRDPYFSREQQF